MSDKQHLVAAVKRRLCWLRALFFGLAVCMLLVACDRDMQQSAGLPDKVTLSFTTTADGALAQIALEKGFFQEEGLRVKARIHPYGKLALQELIEGKADFATSGETPLMFGIMSGAEISVIATIQSSRRDNMIVARRDRGIHSVNDLRGKKIATVQGTTSNYFLQGVLAIHGIAQKEVEIVDIPPHRMSDALIAGEVDAMAALATYAIPVRKKLAANAAVLEDKNLQTSAFLIAGSQDFIRKHPKQVEKILRALVRAEEYVSSYPEAAQQIVANFIRQDMDSVKEVWAESNYKVSLNQTLLLALEDESRWAIRNKLCQAGEVPNYLNYIYLDGLRAVKPDAVEMLR